MEMNQLQKQQTQRSITFKANGDDVTLSPSIVRDYLVRGNSKEVTGQEIAMFLNLCKFQHLNPFLNEAFIVKFGDKPAQLITSKEAFMKRAESHPQYNGLKAGVIVVNNNGVEFRNGAFTVPDFDQLVGGWCEVYRKDRDIPVRVEISLSEFSKGQSTWKTMPATMIRKTAIVNALREAFPAQLGAMYTAEEKGIKDADYVEIKDEVEQDKRDHANKKHIVIEASSATSQVVDKETGEINRDNNAAKETPTNNAKVAENANNAPNPGF